MKATINASPYLRVRDTPGLTGVILGHINNGTTIEVVDVVNENWARVSLTAAGVQLLTGNSQNKYGYMHTSYLLFPQNPPVPAQQKIIYGLNGIDRTYEMEEAAKKGVKFFVVINDNVFANKLADEYGCMVIFRSYWLNGLDTPQRAFTELSEPHLSRNVYGVIGDNENEHRDGKDIKYCAEWDCALASMIKNQNPNKHFLAGTFSVGTPNITNDERIADLVAKYYSPAYNSRLIDFDMHLYTPQPKLMRQRLNDLIYYELRWRELFTKCNFDPLIKGMYSTEWGWDVGGSGGFKAFNTSQDLVETYYTEHAQIMGEPFMVNGTLVPSPFVAGATFALGNHPNWLSYNMMNYYEGLLAKGLITKR